MSQLTPGIFTIYLLTCALSQTCVICRGSADDVQRTMVAEVWSMLDSNSEPGSTDLAPGSPRVASDYYRS